MIYRESGLDRIFLIACQSGLVPESTNSRRSRGLDPRDRQSLFRFKYQDTGVNQSCSLAAGFLYFPESIGRKSRGFCSMSCVAGVYGDIISTRFCVLIHRFSQSSD